MRDPALGSCWFRSPECESLRTHEPTSITSAESQVSLVEDLNVLISGWEVPGYVDPVTHPWIAADFDCKLNGSPFTGYSRIRVEDLNILVTNWETDAGIPMASPNCGGEVDLSPP